MAKHSNETEYIYKTEINNKNGLLVQLAEHMSVKHGVEGSSPSQTVPADVLSICQCLNIFVHFFPFFVGLGRSPCK